jgi:hypothetical protein
LSADVVRSARRSSVLGSRLVMASTPSRIRRRRRERV